MAPGECMHDMPALSQGKTSNCWAFAYSALVDGYRACQLGQSLKSHVTSPWTLPLSNNQHLVSQKRIDRELNQCSDKDTSCVGGGNIITARASRKDDQGGSFTDAHKIFTQYNHSKSCNHSKLGLTDSTEALKFFSLLRNIFNKSVDSNFEETMGVNSYYLRNYKSNYLKCEQYRSDYNSSMITFYKDAPEDTKACKRVARAKSEAQKFAAFFNGPTCQQVLPGIELGALQFAARFVMDMDNWMFDDANQLAQAWVLKRCHQQGANKVVKLPKLNTFPAVFSGSFFSTINNQLDKKKPVGVSICATQLRNPNSNYSGVVSPGKNYSCTTQRCGCSPHAMVIVGRKKLNNGMCGYILKNSWGPGCSGYHEAFQENGLCDPATGNVIVPHDFLEQNIMTVNHF